MTKRCRSASAINAHQTYPPDPDSATMHGTHEYMVFLLRMISSLPAPAGHHGRAHLDCSTMVCGPRGGHAAHQLLVGFSKLHCYCLDDIYTAHPSELPAAYVHLLWRTVISGKNASKASNTEQLKRSYPHTLYVYLVASVEINLHTLIMQEALPTPRTGTSCLTSRHVYS